MLHVVTKFRVNPIKSYFVSSSRGKGDHLSRQNPLSGPLFPTNTPYEQYEMTNLLIRRGIGSGITSFSDATLKGSRSTVVTVH
jgi:hypothetical protein